MKPLLFFILLLTTLSGCVHQSATPVIDNPQHYQQQLSQLTHWSLEGKIAVRQANTSDSAALQWQQNGEKFDIFISGPLGAGATRLTGTPKQLAVQNSREVITTTGDPELMIEKQLGWTLPLGKLPQWITGRSNSNTARFNPDNTLAGFDEHAWQVEYQRYQAIGQWLLPEKIILKREDMQVTIFIKHWELP